MGRATRLLQAPAAPVPSQVPGLLNNNNNNLQHLLHLLRNIDMIGDLACWAPHSQSKNILLSTSEILTECHVWLLASDHLKDTSGIQRSSYLPTSNPTSNHLNESETQSTKSDSAMRRSRRCSHSNLLSYRVWGVDGLHIRIRGYAHILA